MNNRLYQYLGLLLCGALVILAYAWFISSGLWITWPATTNYYDRLAIAFREGHLYLDDNPDPALLKLPDPYEPDARKSIQGLGIDEPNTIWDMALYKGKVYLYWGPAPALFIAVIKPFYGHEIGDQRLTFLFLAGLMVFQILILLRLWHRFFVELPFWIVLSCIFLLAFINPVIWILNIPRIYEAAITAGQFFLIGGLYFIFAGLDRLKYSLWRLGLGSAFWVFAVGSRATMAIPISFLGLMVLIFILLNDRKNTGLSILSRQLAGFSIPLLGGAAGLGWYNHARFGSIFEFGFRYEITMLNQNKYKSILFSPIYSIPNSYLYLFNPPSVNSIFPFIRPVWNEDFISNFNNYYHTIFNAERITGLIYVFPFSVFSIIAVWILLAALFKNRLLQPGDPKSKKGEGNDRLIKWFLISLTGSLILELLTVFMIFYGTMRYLMDATPTLVLLSIIGFWQGYLTLIKRPGLIKLYVAIGLSLLIASIVISILIGFSGDLTRLRSNNPSLLTHLKLFFVHAMNFFGK